jgi:hypothetical protein
LSAVERRDYNTRDMLNLKGYLYMLCYAPDLQLQP